MTQAKRIRKEPGRSEKKGNKTEDHIKKFLEMRDKLIEDGVDLEALNGSYQGKKARKTFIPEEEAETLDVAEKIHQPYTQSSERIGFSTPTRGKKITAKGEKEILKPDGSAESIIETTELIAACGKKLSSKEEIAGFCDVCGKGECSEHVRYCVGYKDFPCNKLLCIKDTRYFTEEDGTRQPCCPDHYNVRLYRQKSVPDFEPEPEKKPKKPEEGQDGG